MVTVPHGSIVLDNPNGMAPGLIMEKNGKTAILLPGPPNELYPLFEGQVFPYLEKKTEFPAGISYGEDLRIWRKPGRG